VSRSYLRLVSRVQGEGGQATIEYTLIVALVAGIAVAVLGVTLNEAITGFFTSLGAFLASLMPVG